MIENNFITSNILVSPSNGNISNSPIKLIKIDPFPSNTEDKWKKTQLRTDSHGRYFHSEITGTGTNYASYIIISPLMVNGAEIKKD